MSNLVYAWASDLSGATVKWKNKDIGILMCLSLGGRCKWVFLADIGFKTYRNESEAKAHLAAVPLRKKDKA